VAVGGQAAAMPLKNEEAPAGPGELLTETMIGSSVI